MNWSGRGSLRGEKFGWKAEIMRCGIVGVCIRVSRNEGDAAVWCFFILSNRIAVSFVADVPIMIYSLRFASLVTGFLHRADRRSFHGERKLGSKEFFSNQKRIAKKNML